MVTLQILSKILKTKDLSIIENNCLDVNYFVHYEDEYNYLINHYNEYGNVPDEATFLKEFPSFEILDVQESDRYLLDKLNEEHLFKTALPAVQKIVELMEVDANQAVEYMLNATKDLKPNYSLKGTDIIKDATKRYDEYVDRKDKQDNWFFTTGFPELDDVTHGIQRTEEFYVIFARTNQGKSWVLEKMCTHIWEIGFNVGYVSPEMSASSVGYRFDTLLKNYSNKDLFWGKDGINQDEYKKYIDDLTTHKNKFIVATPNDFNKQLTVSKVRNFVKQHNLDVIAIDGITYMQDERAKKGDNKTTKLTNISEDLMALSIELEIPILVVVQANRGGADVDDNGTPDLENIRDSDGIAHNASKVISLKQGDDGVLTLQVKKQRNGVVGTKVRYMWNVNNGEFISMNDSADMPIKRKIDKKEDVF